MLPGLLELAQWPNSGQSADVRDLVVQAYRFTAAVLVRTDVADLAWQAADRATAAAGQDAFSAATSAILLTRALRVLDRYRLAVATGAAVARRMF